MKPIELPLARAAVDRAGELRINGAELEKLWERASVIHLSSGKFASSSSGLLHLTSREVDASIDSGKFAAGIRLFLGQDLETFKPYFAWCSDDGHEGESLGPDFKSLREIGDHLSDLDMGLAVHSQALSNWHHTHHFCPKCGSATTPGNGGSVRRCDVDGSEHYPRTDPAMIVLVKDRTDRILLGRQKVWPENRFSNFAGFVDSGESFEHCVAREVMEEVGLSVTEITYLGSQPWPFPSSIMIAFVATTDEPESARPDGEEIVEMRWFSRAQMKASLIDGTLLLPPGMSVSRRMIEAWFTDDPAFSLSDLQSSSQ